MAHMVSPAGDMEVSLLRISRVGDQIVIVGRIGVWDSEIYFAPEENMRLARSMLSASLLLYLLWLPFLILYRRLVHRGQK